MGKLEWRINKKKTVGKFPIDVIEETLFALFCEQEKKTLPCIYPMREFKDTVREIKVNYLGDTYRTVYVVNLGKKIYVLHAFQKKSKTGIATPKYEIDLIKKRLKELKQELKEHK